MILKEFTIYKGVPFNSSYSDVLDFGEYTPESESAGKDYIKNFLDNNYEKKVYSNINKGINIYGLNCKIKINMQVDDYYQYNYICAKFVDSTVSTKKRVLYFYFIDKIDVINSINGQFTCSLSLVKDCWTNNLYNIYFGDYDKHMVINRRHKDAIVNFDSIHCMFKSNYRNSFPSISNNYIENMAKPVENSIVEYNDYELVCLLVTLDPTKYYLIKPNLGTIKNATLKSGNAVNSSKNYVYIPYGIRLKGSTEFINFGKDRKAVLNYVKNYDSEHILQWTSNDMINNVDYFTKIENSLFSDSQYFVSVNKTVSFPIKINSITTDPSDSKRSIYNMDTEIYNNSVVGGELDIIIVDSGGGQKYKKLLPFCFSIDCDIEGYELDKDIKDFNVDIIDDYIFNKLLVKGKSLNEIFFPRNLDFIKETSLFDESFFRYIPDTYMYPFKYIKIKTPLEDIEIKNNLYRFSFNIKKYFVRDGFSYSYNYLENGKLISDFISNVKTSYHLSSYPITTDQYQKFMDASYNSFNTQYTNKNTQIGYGAIASALAFVALAVLPVKFPVAAAAGIGALSTLGSSTVNAINTERERQSALADIKNQKGVTYSTPISCTNDLFFYDGIYIFLEEVNTELLEIKKSIYDIYYYGTSIKENADITETFQNNFDFISVEKCDIPSISNFEERKICENIFNNGVTRWHVDGYLQAVKNCNKEYVNFNRIIIIKGA